MTVTVKRPRPSGFNWLKTRPDEVAKLERPIYRFERLYPERARIQSAKAKKQLAEAAAVALEAKRRLKRAAEGK